jgi:hypothetical protein
VFDDENDLQQLTFIQHHLQAEIASKSLELVDGDASVTPDCDPSLSCRGKGGVSVP